jgi:Beta-lactamase enzyme family
MPVANPLRPRWIVVLSAAVLLALASGAVAGDPPQGDHAGGRQAVWPREVYPSSTAVRRAQRFAAARGDAAFAVMDSSAGLRGYEIDRTFSAASATKVLLLAAELRELQREHEPLDAATRSLLRPMITYSDNRAANAVYARVGDAGMEDAAKHAGMRNFNVDPGFWGGAQITAADMARFYFRLEGNLGGRYREYGLRLLAGITPLQRWGIPAVAGRSWRIWFKGGWRPAGQEGTTGAVTHQAALLEHRHGERMAIAVLTNEAPGAGGYTAIEGVALRLLAKPPPRRDGWPVP